MALTIYSHKEYVPSGMTVINTNDRWFSIEFLRSKLPVDSTVIDMMSAIDSAIYIEKDVMNTPFGNCVNMSNLSTGCKTAINVHTFKDICFNTIECGNNAIFEMLKLRDGNIILDGGFYFPVELDEVDDDFEADIIYIDHCGMHHFHSANSLREYIDGEYVESEGYHE